MNQLVVVGGRREAVRPVATVGPVRNAARIRAIGRWTVMDHAEIAWVSDGASAAVAEAKRDALRALVAEAGAAGLERARFRTITVERERRGAFLAWTAIVEAEL
jgi:hypothetical protein